MEEGYCKIDLLVQQCGLLSLLDENGAGVQSYNKINNIFVLTYNLTCLRMFTSKV